MRKVTGAESLVGTKLPQRQFSNRLALDETPARSVPVVTTTTNINRVAPRESNMDFQRSARAAPPLESGYWRDDLNYTAGGRGLGRSTVAR